MIDLRKISVNVPILLLLIAAVILIGVLVSYLMSFREENLKYDVHNAGRNITGSYVFAEETMEGSGEWQSALVLYNDPIYIVDCSASGYDSRHLFWFFTNDLLESETLGKGAVFESNKNLVIKFKKGRKKWILKRTSAE